MLAIIKNLPGNYLILLPNTPHYTIAEVSAAYNVATYSRREDLIGVSVFEAFPDDPNDPAADGVLNLSNSFAEVLETKRNHEMPVQRYPVPAAGRDSFIEKFWVPVNTPVIVNDQVLYIIHSVTDVTQSKQLKSREEYFKALADESPFMIWRSAGPSCIYVNRAWIETTGISFENSLGSGYFNAFHPEDAALQKSLLKQAVNNNESYESTFRILDHKGDIRWVFMRASPSQVHGATVEYIGSMIDVTTQELAAQRIRESEKQFRQLADSIIQMIWVTDAEGMHEYYNQRWYDFTGTTHEETEGEGWNHVFHPDDRERAWKVWRHSLQTGTPYEIEYRLRKYTGEYIWVLGRAAPYFDNDGNIIKWFGTCTDINEQKILQQQKDEFINIASHELKTPLTGLSANIQFMEKMLHKRQDPDPLFVKLVGASYTNVRKLNKLVDELLNANSIGTGELAVKKDWFELIGLISEAIAYLNTGEIAIRQTGLKAIDVHADAGKIEQVVVNYVNNALKYASESEFIEINVSESDKDVKVSVIDRGKGIAEEKLKYLFDRYYQVESKSERYSGMGLGLYICASIINNHGGKIGVESTLSKGSTFWFTIPKDER
ncbi:PAS domain S-box-containing protein [Daejeonella lutea]|uniref:histidine kinase n=2 Tax=Daejeonella lutea TaxID=572036 RepID=A0A1T5AX47_9SPHI|nr:PAS domain S-box-containing protein [Daejeonella lutea]